MNRCLFAMALLFFASFSFHVLGQSSNSDSPVAHIEYFSAYENELRKDYLSYMSEVAHGGRARKMEKRRLEVVNSIKEALRNAGKLRPYKGDASLRDAYREYWNVLLSVFNEDYHKIVDMEEVAERSYDAMEAYLLIQEKSSEKLDDAYEKVATTFREFAAKNNITLTDGNESKLTRKLGQVGRVNKYCNTIYLINFKSTVQEQLMIEALNKKDVNAMEQTKNSMLKYALEGLQKLDTMKAFKGDGSMITACRKVLEFQKDEALNKMNIYTDFLLKSEEMEKIRKSFEAKPANQRTKADVDAFNTSVNNYNKSINQYNKVNDEVNTARSKVLNNYEVTKKRFIDNHIPHA